MSTRFWIFCAGLLGAAAATGVGLGGYAAGEGPVGWREAPAALTLPDPVANPLPPPPAAASPGPAIIRCKGCGPTLAERRMAADMAGLDADGLITGTRDPAVRDYMAQDDPAPAATSPPAQPGRPLQIGNDRTTPGASDDPASVDRKEAPTTAANRGLPISPEPGARGRASASTPIRLGKADEMSGE